MKKLISSTLIGVVATLIIGVPVLAAVYSASLSVLETGGTTYAQLPMIVDVNNQWLVDYGFMSASGRDTRVETLSAVPYKHLVADNKTLFSGALEANSKLNLQYTTGNIPADMSIITGYDGYITTPDAPSIELGDNFTIRATGICLNTDNGTDKNILRKDDAIYLYESTTVSGDVTAEITKTGLSATLYPDGPGYISQWAVTGAATNWQAVAAQGSGEYVSQNVGSTSYDSYTYQIGSINANSIIDSVKYYICSQGGSGQTYIYPFTRLNGTNQAATTIDMNYVTAPTWYERTISTPPGGGSWTYDKILNLEAGFSAGGYGIDVFAAKIVVTYHDVVSVTVSNVEETEQPYFELSANTTHLILNIDGTSNSTALGGASVPDNANDLILFENNSVAYCDSFFIEVDGIEQLRYQPNAIISGTTLPDLTGTNDGTITWGTNPAGVTLSLGNMVSDYQPSTEYVEEPVSDILGEAGGSDWFVEPDLPGTLATHPLRPFVRIFSDNTTMSERQAWVWLGIALVIMVMIGVAVMVRGHHLITGIATGAIMGLLVAQTIFPLWTLIFAVAAIAAGIISERSNQL